MWVHRSGGASFAGMLERAIGMDDAQKQKLKRDQKHKSGEQTQMLRQEWKHASDVWGQSRYQIQVLQGSNSCFESGAGMETCDENHHGKSPPCSQTRY